MQRKLVNITLRNTAQKNSTVDETPVRMSQHAKREAARNDSGGVTFPDSGQFRRGRQCLLVAGDLSKAERCRSLVQKIVEAFGRIDVVVNNAAHQMSFNAIEEISDEEWDLTLATNISAMFYITKAAVPHMKPGSSIINTASVNADSPSPQLLAYATTKGAIQNFTGGLAQLLAEWGIRANAVAPGPVWTPLIPSTMPPQKVEHFGEQVPMKRPAQPKELAPVYVMLASNEASYVSGATVAVTGGKPII
jgi:NAD(P)-dependent dehydrogenase (short-subunit alcohol dehydrogenase family)